MRADLALIGFGHVGRRFATLIDERREQLSAEHGLDCRIVGIATRRHGAVAAADGIDVRAAIARVAGDQPLPGNHHHSASDVIGALARSDAPLRVAIETTTLSIADGQPAIAHVEAAIDAGCHVVTANKGPVAFAYRRLRDRARAAGVSFLFEGAVMDGVPIFNLVRDTLPAVTITGFRGVVNSTTNFILSALEEARNSRRRLPRCRRQGSPKRTPRSTSMAGTRRRRPRRWPTS